MEILLPRIKYTHELVGTHGGALLPERAPGACSGNKIPRVYRPLVQLETARFGAISSSEIALKFRTPQV